MPTYYDSSFLLAGLLGQPGAERLPPYWDNEPDRLASVLTEAECLCVLRRAAEGLPENEAGTFLATRIEKLDDLLGATTVRLIDREILDALRAESRLRTCRTLDALHLAAALLYQSHCGDPISIATLDQRMRGLASNLGFQVVPPDGPAVQRATWPTRPIP